MHCKLDGANIIPKGKAIIPLNSTYQKWNNSAAIKLQSPEEVQASKNIQEPKKAPVQNWMV